MEIDPTCLKEYSDDIYIDNAIFFSVYVSSLIFAALLGYGGSYFITILYFYKKKKEKFELEVENALKKQQPLNAVADDKEANNLFDSSSAPKKIRKNEATAPPPNPKDVVPINHASAPPNASVPPKKK